MAQITFTIANGGLEVADGGGMYSFHASDYRAKSVWNATRLRIVIYPILHQLTPATRREWETDDVANFLLNGTQYGTVEAFVEAFNAIAGASIGFNTKYPETLFSRHIALDTSVDEQVATAAIIAANNAGYVIITAPDTNNGDIYVGDSGVNNESYALHPDRSVTLEIDDLSKIWVQSSVAGDHVSVIGVAKI